MVQTSYDQDMGVKFPGRYTVSGRGLQSAGCNDSNNVQVGRVVVFSDNTGKKVSLPYSNQATLVLDGDLVTSNVLAGNVVVNGVTTAYTETFASDHDTTMAALAVELAAIDGIASAVVSDANNRTITLVPDASTDVYFSSGAVTAGAGQAGVTLANTCTSTIAGVAVHSEKMPDASGVVEYINAQDVVPFLTNGQVDIVTDDALDVSDTIYFRFYQESAADEKRGMIGAADGLGADSAPSTSLALGASKAKDLTAAAGTATITVNIP